MYHQPGDWSKNRRLLNYPNQSNGPDSSANRRIFANESPTLSQNESLTDDGTTETFPPLADRAIVITGPTASGKSALAIDLATQINGEIISLDSIAVYRGMDIGTAKASQNDQSRVAHHLIDVVDPTEDFSVACYLTRAHSIVDQVVGRGRVPIFAGGTPMFLKGVLRGFDPGPPADWQFRESVEAEVQTHGAVALHQRLSSVDPLAAAKIDPRDVRRMIRALEVAKVTGQPLSHRQVQFDRPVAPERCNAFVVQWERSVLHQRINDRVGEMFELGLVDEVQDLLDRHGELSRTASQAVGYRELIEWNRETQTVDQLKEIVAAHTRQLARRQETWFRSFNELAPVDGSQLQDTNARTRWIESVRARIDVHLKTT